jgi:hypothetical protein
MYTYFLFWQQVLSLTHRMYSVRVYIHVCRVLTLCQFPSPWVLSQVAYVDISPVNYHFAVHSMSSEMVPFQLPMVRLTKTPPILSKPIYILIPNMLLL